MSDAAAGRRFSASEAAFTGFRLIAREPTTFAIWCGLVIAFWFACAAAALTLFGGAFAELSAINGASDPDPAAAVRVFGSLAPLVLVAWVVGLAFYAIAYAAVNRALLRPEAPSFAHLAFGPDELRQAGLMLWSALIALGFGFLVMIALIALRMALPGQAGALFLLVLLLAPALIFVGVRLSLASPATFDTAEVRFLRAWPRTRGRFWPLLGAYLLAFFVMLVVQLIVSVVAAAITLALGGGLAGAGALFSQQPMTLDRFLTPVQIAGSLLNALLTTLQFVIFLAVPAGAYAQLRELERPAPAVAPTTGF